MLIGHATRPGVNSIQEVDEPALIPHIAEASSIKYPYEVLFRSLHKLLMDTATSEYFTVYSSVVYDLQNVICSKFVDFLINSFYFTGIIFVMIFLEKNLCFMRSLRVIMIESLTYCWLTYTDVKLPI